jgi:hypothetical protein
MKCILIVQGYLSVTVTDVVITQNYSRLLCSDFGATIPVFKAQCSTASQ